MGFDRPEGPDEEFHAHQLRLNKMSQLFWQRMSDMITGPEHEYVYLKRLVKRFHQRSHHVEKTRASYKLDEQQCNKIKKKLLAGKGGATSPKAHAPRSPALQGSNSPSSRQHLHMARQCPPPGSNLAGGKHVLG